MSNGTLALKNNYNLTPSKLLDSWSQFTREYSSAVSIIPIIPKGKYIEVKDKKFQGDGLIIFRRSDFDNLNMLSSLASRITRCLMQIDRMTTTFSNGNKPEDVIKLIHEEAKLGIELTVVPTTTTADEYFSMFKTSEEIDEDDFVMPETREDIEGN